jgi:hypothetical protein
VTLAEKYCAMDPDLAGEMAEAAGAIQTVGVDDTGELVFPDGSAASCCEGSGWVPERLRDDVRAAILDRMSEADLAAKARDEGPDEDWIGDGRPDGLFTPAEDENPDWVGWEADDERRLA